MAVSRSSSTSPSPGRQRPKSWIKKLEKCCCSTATYFPLAFVYGLTTWAVWVEASLAPQSSRGSLIGYTASCVGILLYVLLNWSYTVAVFTDPGSPSTSTAAKGYSHLPTEEPLSSRSTPSLTVKSTGGLRYCKKCEARKPDRAHHCSTCRRCVLKMDHHCPWLATCVGLKNYKAFMLFLIYTSAFCWLCFVVTAIWLWKEILNEELYSESLMPINNVLLCTVSGIIGLAITGFAGWHVNLAWKGQTTIECLEKTRYLTPLRTSMKKQFGSSSGQGHQSYGQQLAEIHANALPGVTRQEEGEEDPMLDRDLEHGISAHDSLRSNHAAMEWERERERYEQYLDDRDSEKLPNAFDLGWKKNLRHLFGDRFWLLPICNTLGDGWHWEPSTKWLEAREEIRRQRESHWRDSPPRQIDSVSGRYKQDAFGEPLEHWSNGKTSQDLGKTSVGYFHQDKPDERPSSRMSMRTLRRRESFSERDDSNDNGDKAYEETRSSSQDEDENRQQRDEWRDWD